MTAFPGCAADAPSTSPPTMAETTANATRPSTVRRTIDARVPRDARVLLAVLAVASLAVAGCGSSPDPLGKARDAAKKTLGLSGVSYDLRLQGQSLFPGLLGGRAAYD